jgi:hypothetical protein
MQGHAFLTSPLPHLKRTQPFRAAGGNAPPQTEHVWELYCPGTTRVKPPAAIDLYDSALRSIDQPASDFAIPVSSPASSASRLDLPVMPHETVRHHGEEMPPPVGDFRRQRPCANLLPAPLNTPSCFSSCVRILVLRSLNPLDRDDALQTEIDAEGGRVALFDLWYFDPDVDIPTPAGVGGELPRFGLPFSDIGLKSRR